MKKTNNILYWFIIAIALTFILYQKGIIFANFESISPTQAAQYLTDNNTTLLDVRTKEELVKEGMIAGAIHIPLQQLQEQLSQLKSYHDRKIIVYCRSGNRSVFASRILEKAGFHVYNLKGDINAWKSQNLPLR